MSDYREQGVVFRGGSGDNRLVGVAAIPEIPADLGVIILVGGPQYRVGSHRQFTLLARSLAEAGCPSLRFDYAGMGDSEGERYDFCNVESDISCAIEALCETVPGLSRVVLWGLCDGASSAMMFAHRCDKVVGMLLLNPWVHGDDYSPQVKLSHYYRQLLTGKDYWVRLLSGKVRLLPALKASGRAILSFIGIRAGGSVAQNTHSFIGDMRNGLQEFRHEVLVVLSENDLTASEFSDLIANDRGWVAAMSKPGITVNTVPGADHTFSSRLWREEIEKMTIEWVDQRKSL